MHRSVFIAATLVVALTGPALANHNVPGKAKLLKVSFVPAEAPCTAPTLDHRPPLGLVFHGCVPSASTNSTAANELTFGPGGSLTARIKAKSGDVAFSFKGQGILNNGVAFTGTLIAVATLRVTDHACGSTTPYIMPCTVQDVDFSLPFSCNFGICVGGKTANDVFAGAVAAGEQASLEFRDIVIKDPDCTPPPPLPQISTCPTGQDDAFRIGLFVP